MRPMVLMIDDDAGDRCFAGELFASLGWEPVGATADGWHRAASGTVPALILRGGGNVPAIDVLRAHAAVRDAPIVAWVAAAQATPADVDDVLDKAAGAAGIKALAQRWRPDDPSATLDGLEAALGADEIGEMIGRLRAQLTAALAALATTDHPAEAHRIAGIAGMLGFGQLGAAWLAVSQGVEGSGTAARIATRRALWALRRRCERVSCSTARP
ncbi:hypothetical protein [Sphingomonas sp. 1P08PE]|uniref:hypothetical protein n=1 Tax=Sphingomonas sp. 1P08PE TaxID=554122 RepID=UPI00399F20A8